MYTSGLLLILLHPVGQHCKVYFSKPHRYIERRHFWTKNAFHINIQVLWHFKIDVNWFSPYPHATRFGHASHSSSLLRCCSEASIATSQNTTLIRVKHLVFIQSMAVPASNPSSGFTGTVRIIAGSGKIRFSNEQYEETHGRVGKVCVCV